LIWPAFLTAQLNNLTLEHIRSDPHQYALCVLFDQLYFGPDIQSAATEHKKTYL